MASPGAGELLDPLLESLGQGEHFRAECRSLLDKICALVPSAGALMQGLGPSANEPAEDEFRRLQCATAIWALKRLTPQPSVSPTGDLPLGRVAEACDLTYASFFSHGRDIIQRCESLFSDIFGPKSARVLQERLQTTVEQLLYTVAFKRLYASKLAVIFRDASRVGYLGWVLFLAIRARVPSQTQSDQHFVATLITCCTNILVASAPLSLLREPNEWLKSRDEEGRRDTLASLGELFKLGSESLPSLRVAMQQIDQAASAVLASCHAATAAPAAPAGRDMACSCSYRPRLIAEDGSCEEATQAASAAYEERYAAYGEVDERLIWSDEGCAAVGDMRTVTATPRKPPAVGTPRKGSGAPAPPSALLTPMAPRSAAPPPQTPISGALHGSQWLAAMAAEEPDPLQSVPECMACLGTATAQAAVLRAWELVRAVLQPDTRRTTPELFQPAHVSGRPAQALKLWARAVRHMVQAEPDPGAALRRILGSDRTSRVLVACVLEMLAGAAHLVDLKFPTIPTRLGLTPFDLFKFIKPLTKGEPTLPEDVRRHMAHLLVAIVESRAYEPPSSFFAYLCAAVGAPCPPAVLPPDAAPGGSAAPAVTAVSAASLPRALGADDADGAAAGEATSSQASPPHGAFRKVVEDLFRDALKLGQERVQALVDRLPPEGFSAARADGSVGAMDPRAVVAQAGLMVQAALHRQTHLVYNRHLDQIVMCALYGVCKVHNMSAVKFKDIVDAYQHLPHAIAHTYRNVVLSQTPLLEVQERNDIIKFYNKVFMPAMKGSLLQCASEYRRVYATPNTRGELPGSPDACRAPSAPAVIVSPLKHAGLSAASQLGSGPQVVHLGIRTQAFSDAARDLEGANRGMAWPASPGDDAAGDEHRRKKHRLAV